VEVVGVWGENSLGIRGLSPDRPRARRPPHPDCLGADREGLNWRDSATRHIGTFRKIWPRCFGRRAGFRGIFQQIAEIGVGRGQRDRRRHGTFRRDRRKMCGSYLRFFRSQTAFPPKYHSDWSGRPDSPRFAEVRQGEAGRSVDVPAVLDGELLVGMGRWGRMGEG